MNKWKQWLLRMFSLGLVVSLTSCISGTPSCDMLTRIEQRAGHTPTDTLSRDRGYYNVEKEWPSLEPELFVIATPNDLTNIKPYIMRHSYEDLMKIDLTSQVAIVVFSGKTNYDGYVFCTTSWVRVNHEVTVFSHLIQQPTMAPITASYYDIFQITKDENWKGNFNFKLQYMKHEPHTNAYNQEITTAKLIGIAAQTTVNFR